MGAKAVYASSSLAVYLSGGEFDDFLDAGEYLCELWIGRKRIPTAYAEVKLEPQALDVIRQVCRGEREVIEAARKASREGANEGNPT